MIYMNNVIEDILQHPPRNKNPMCVCGHRKEEHLYHKIPDGEGGHIENDDQKCQYWDSCGCQEFKEEV